MKSVALGTLGCKVNQYETEAISELFASAGYQVVDFDDFADVYVINTCTVTSMSDRKSRQMIRRAKRRNPDAYIAVCGCYAQTAPDEIYNTDAVNLVLGTNLRHKIVELTEQGVEGIYVNDISKDHTLEKLSISKHSGKTRAYVKVQEGCNQFCTYCIIPYARGPVRSRPLKEVVEESKRLAESGYTELVYVGIHIASYGLDTKEGDLADLIVAVNEIPDIKRIRLSSIEPMTLDHTFCEKIKDCDKLCPHFHLSLQSGSDTTLARMNRKYTTREYKDIVDGLRRLFPDCSITTDIMVGFPAETDEEFEQTLQFAKDISFQDAHIFKYSQRAGTPADKMSCQISPEIKDIRSKKLTEICRKSRDEFLEKYIGRQVEVLFEDKNGEYLEGKTANYSTVFVKTNEQLSGKYKSVKVSDAKGGILYAELI